MPRKNSAQFLIVMVPESKCGKLNSEIRMANKILNSTVKRRLRATSSKTCIYLLFLHADIGTTEFLSFPVFLLIISLILSGQVNCLDRLPVQDTVPVCLAGLFCHCSLRKAVFFVLGRPSSHIGQLVWSTIRCKLEELALLQFHTQSAAQNSIMIVAVWVIVNKG